MIYDIYLNIIFDNHTVSYIHNNPHLEVLVYRNTEIVTVIERPYRVPDFLLDNLDLHDLSKLKVLDIVDKTTGKKFFSKIYNLPNLEYLSVKGNPYPDSNNINSLIKLKNLRVLKICSCPNIDNNFIDKISELTNLEYLYIDSFNSNTKITDEGFRQFHKLKNLKRLVLNNMYISDNTLKEISRINSLHDVNLDNCPYITNQGIKHLSLLPNLTSLGLSNCDKITELNSEMFLSFPKLTKLSLSDFSQTTSVNLQNLTKAPYLKELILFNISELNDKSIDFNNQSSKLEHIQFSYCPLITDNGLKQLSNLNSLNHLSIISNPLITDKSIDFLRMVNPDLSFSITDCNGYSKSKFTGLNDIQEDIFNEILYGGIPVYKPKSKGN